MDKQEITDFAEAYEFYKIQQHEKTVAANNTAQLMHGPTGLFGVAGLNPEVFSTILQPQGLAAILPKIPTRYTNPQFPILTGQEDDEGSEPTDSCGDPPRACFKKSCVLTAQFGMLQRGTCTIDPSRIITLLNRGEFTDLSLVGAVPPDPSSGFAAAGTTGTDAILNNVVVSQMNSVGISFERALTQQLWQGVTAGGTAGYQQFPGLDVQITTNNVDSISNVTCPATDSDVKDFNYNPICGTSPSIVEYMSMIEYYIYHIAQRTRMNCEWVWVMRPEMWKELTECWPLAYNTQKYAILAGNTSLNLNGVDVIRDRDAMRRGMTIDVNGRTYRVIEDDGIFEHDSTNNANLIPGQYASSIYFVPLRANGYPVTRIEYLDYRMIFNFVNAAGELANKVTFWTNDGMFLWVYRDLPGFCFDIIGRTEQRVVLQTPHLAGRIDHVMIEPLQHLRSEYVDSPYFKNGGVSTRTAPRSYAIWGNR